MFFCERNDEKDSNSFVNMNIILVRNLENGLLLITENKRENDANEGITQTNSLLHTNKVADNKPKLDQVQWCFFHHCFAIVTLI